MPNLAKMARRRPMILVLAVLAVPMVLVAPAVLVARRHGTITTIGIAGRIMAAGCAAGAKLTVGGPRWVAHHA
ncbi:MAG: hypothetical protein ACYDD1_14065 [Caulobacteraceae bacterium]